MATAAHFVRDLATFFDLQNYQNIILTIDFEIFRISYTDPIPEKFIHIKDPLFARFWSQVKHNIETICKTFNGRLIWAPAAWPDNLADTEMFPQKYVDTLEEVFVRCCELYSE